MKRALAIASFAAIVALPTAAQEVPFVGADRSPDAIARELGQRPPRRVRPVGTTSVTLKLDLATGLDAAFKPRTRSHPRGYLSEIAAYRIARALGMDNVPPVVGRQIARPLLEERFEPSNRGDWESVRSEILWDNPGVAHGAAIYWIPSMRSSEYDSPQGLDRAAAWLALDGEVPAERVSIARDLSTMIAFDYVIGNWDRFSGGNVSTNEAGDRLFVRDHNIAFAVPLSAERYTRLRGLLERVQRFSRSFVARLQALDADHLAATLAADPQSELRPILAPAQVDGVLVRRRAVLSYVAALIALHGEDRVLAWP